MVRAQRFLPRLEIAEALTLPSVSIAAIAGPLHLQGEVRGMGAVITKVKAKDPVISRFIGTGKIAPLGAVRVSYEEVLLTRPGTGTGSEPAPGASEVVLSGSRGRIFLDIVSSNSDSKQFIVSGGTGAYRGATGTGSLSFIVDGRSGFKAGNQPYGNTELYAQEVVTFRG